MPGQRRAGFPEGRPDKTVFLDKIEILPHTQGLPAQDQRLLAVVFCLNVMGNLQFIEKPIQPHLSFQGVEIMAADVGMIADEIQDLSDVGLLPLVSVVPLKQHGHEHPLHVFSFHGTGGFSGRVPIVHQLEFRVDVVLYRPGNDRIAQKKGCGRNQGGKKVQPGKGDGANGGHLDLFQKVPDHVADEPFLDMRFA